MHNKKTVLFIRTLKHSKLRDFVVSWLRCLVPGDIVRAIFVFSLLTLPLFPYTRALLPASLTRLGLGTQTAYAATNDTLNFQARLETGAGAIAGDGYYNVQFKLYDASSGGTLLWTETRAYNTGAGACSGPLGTNDCRVRVANGYLTVDLGSLTSFPSTIPWDQQLYLTMNIGGTVTAGSYPGIGDGEMTPRLKLTAVPYAMNAKQISTYNSVGGYTSTLSIQAPTGGNQIFQIPDQGAGGTYTLLTGSAANGSYIQNQSSTDQSASFRISGSGQVNTFLANTTVTVGSASTQGQMVLHTGNGYTTTLKSGASGANRTITLPVNNGSNGDCVLTDGAGQLSFGSCGSGGGGGVSSVGAIDTQTKSADGAVISGTSIYMQTAQADKPGLVGIGAQTFAGNKTFQDGITFASATTTYDRILIAAANAGTNRFDGTITNKDLTAARTWSMPDASGTVAVSASGNIALDSATGNITFSGTLPIANGGTNSSAAIGGAGSVVYSNGTSYVYSGTTASAGQCLQSGTSGTGQPTWGACGGAPSGAAGGDLSGTYPNPTVAKINGQTVTYTSLAANNLLVYNGTNWVNAATAGDVTGTVSGNTLTYAIGTGKITSAMILDGTIATGDISTGGVTSTNILDGTIATGDISTGGVTSTNILDATVTGTDIAAGTVTNANLVNSSLTVTAGTNLSGGGSVALGGTTTINVVNNPTFSGLLTANGGITLGASTTLTNGGATLNTTLALGDLAAGAIGTAATTVDVYTSASIAPTAAGRTYTIPDPTSAVAGRVFYITNANTTNSFTISMNAGALTSTVNPVSGVTLVWNGADWTIAGSGTLSGANTSLSNLSAVNIGTTALNSTSNNLNLTTTTSGNIVLNSAGTIELQDATNVTGAFTTTGTINTNTFSSTALTFSGVNPNISASTAATNISINAGTTGQVQIGGTSTGDILLGGGSASTGCTVTNASGNFACTGTLSGSNFSGTHSGTSSGTNTGDVALAGQNYLSIAGQTITANQINLTSNVTGVLPLANGGTNANLTASNGGIVWTNASQMQVLAGTATAGQCLLSGSNTTPSWGSCGGSGGTLKNAYDADVDGGDAIIALTSTDGGIILRDSSTPLTTAFAVQNNGGTASYFSVSSSQVLMQDSSGNSALLFDSANSELKVYENVASPTRYARVFYSTADNAAVFAASSGATQIGTSSGSGDINFILGGAQADKLVGTKTFSVTSAYSGTDYAFTRGLTGTSYALTGNVFKIEDTSSFTVGSSAPNLLYINQNNTGATGNLILAQTGGATTKFKVDTSGTVTVASGAYYSSAGNVLVRPGADSTTSFIVQDAAGATMLASDTTNERITIGVSDTVGTVLVLDTKTDSTDPTCVNGGMYYNSSSGKFRFCQAGTWMNLATGVDVQNFTANGTWTKPAGVSVVMVIACGGGGGGGGGGTSSTAAGSGGGGGAHVERTMTAAVLGSTVGVTVGATANGGTANGSGSAGNYSSFGSYVYAGGGGNGLAGGASTSSGSGGGAASGDVIGSGSSVGWQGAAGVITNNSGRNSEFGGASGGAGNSGAGGSSILGGTGGGAGANSTNTGGAGGATGSYAAGGGAGGGLSNTAGTAGSAGDSSHCGTGGGGGGGGGPATAGNGGNGGTAGGGGGGGGTGAASGGTGGSGGRGEVWVISW